MQYTGYSVPVRERLGLVRCIVRYLFVYKRVQWCAMEGAGLAVAMAVAVAVAGQERGEVENGPCQLL